MARKKLSCFVIMPFGQKRVGNELIDFDYIWKTMIAPAAKAAGFEAKRVDEEAGQGHITKNMIQHIMEADVAIADLTYHNPNVYYELGMRHALAKHGTIIIKRESGSSDVIETYPEDSAGPIDNIEIPFDLRQMAHFFYKMDDEKLEDNKTNLIKVIHARSSAADTDSPTFTYLPKLRINYNSGKASGRQDRAYKILDRDTKTPTRYTVGYRSGDIANMKEENGTGADFWVNSENNFMQMARTFDKTISATIRYLGGLDPETKKHTDIVQDALRAQLKARDITQVNEGEILRTNSFHLRESHGVKAIFHVATVTCKPRDGNNPIEVESMVESVQEVVRQARALNRQSDDRFHGRSIVMPIFGTGTGKGDASIIAEQLVYAAIEALRSPSKLVTEDTDISEVWFTAYSEDDVDRMRRIFEVLVKDGDLTPTPS